MVVSSGNNSTALGDDGAFDRRALDLGFQLKPATAHPTARRLVDGVCTTSSLLYISGTGPISAGRALFTGQVGDALDVEAARSAARATCVRVLEKIVSTVGSLDRVQQWVSVTGYINSTQDFVDHSQVLDGFTDLVVDIFGERAGLCARCAVGVPSLPLGIPVEVQAVVELVVDRSST